MPLTTSLEEISREFSGLPDVEIRYDVATDGVEVTDKRVWITYQIPNHVIVNNLHIGHAQAIAATLIHNRTLRQTASTALVERQDDIVPEQRKETVEERNERIWKLVCSSAKS
jgi:hypothetical protein